MQEIKKVDVISVGKIYALFGVIIGFIMGLIMASVGALVSAIPGAAAMPVMFFPALGLLAIIVLPTLYGVFCFVIGVIGAAIYNILASRFGGVKIYLK